MNSLFASSRLVPAGIICVVVGIYLSGAAVYQLYRQDPHKEIRPLFEYANQCYAQGDYQSALIFYNKVIDLDPHCGLAYFNNGQIYSHKKEWQLACTHYQKSLDSGVLGCNEYLAYFGYAQACDALGQYDQALVLLDAAINSNQTYPHSYALRAKIKHEKNQLPDALADYVLAGRLYPEYLKGVIAVGNSYRAAGDIDAAIECYSIIARAQPDYYGGYLYRADMLHIKAKQLNDAALFEQAKQEYRRALACNPSCNEALHNLGFMLLEEEQIDEALALFNRALAIKDDSGTHLGVAIAYLLRGDYARGWPEYEARLRGWQEQRHISIARWDGKASLKNKTILLHAEQGYGDTFHFIRYAQLIKQKGARVVLEVQPRLKPLISLCPYIDQVIEQGDAVPRCDQQVPLLSLPALTKTTLDAIPKPASYLYADAKLIDFWRQKLSADKNFKVGICWSVDASHDFTKYHGLGKQEITISTPRRSISYDLMSQIATVAGVSVYSLQKDSSAVQSGAIKVRVFDNFDTQHGAFMDTAALIKNLDLVITVDTSIAHLAGALGVPTWIMLPRYAEWRWLLERSDSVWYPSVTLFRQKQPGDWHELMMRVQAALAQKVKS